MYKGGQNVHVCSNNECANVYRPCHTTNTHTHAHTSTHSHIYTHLHVQTIPVHVFSAGSSCGLHAKSSPEYILSGQTDCSGGGYWLARHHCAPCILHVVHTTPLHGTVEPPKVNTEADNL